MVEEHKQKDAGETAVAGIQNQELQSADASAVRNAPAETMKRAQEANQNKSDGSFHYDPTKASVEIIAYRDDGSHHKTDRLAQLTEKELLKRVTADSKDTPERERLKEDVSGSKKREQISRTGVQLAIESKHNPALEPVAELRAYADMLPEGEEKQKLIELSREQAMEHSPAIRARLEQDTKDKVGINQNNEFEQSDATNKSAITETQLLLPPEEQRDIKVLEGHVDDLSFVVSEYSKLPLDQKLKIAEEAGDVFSNTLADGLGKGFSQMGEEMLKGAAKAATSLVNFGLEAGRIGWDMYNIPEKLGEMAIYLGMGNYKQADALKEETAGTIGKALAFSLAPLRVTYDYGYQWGFSGDPAKPIKDIVALKDSWDKLTPPQQAGLATEIFVSWELPASGLKLAHAGQFSEAFAHMNNVRKTMTLAEASAAWERTQLKIAEFMQKSGLSGPKLAWETAGVEGTGMLDKIGKIFSNPLDELSMKMSPLISEGSKHAITFKEAALKTGIAEKTLKQMVKTKEGLEELAKHGLEYLPREYHEEFMRAHPELIGYEHLFEVHHAIPQEVLERFPKMFKAAEINGLSNLRGIPREFTVVMKGVSKPVHNVISDAWTKLFMKCPNLTRSQIERFAQGLDKRYGQGFIPEVK